MAFEGVGEKIALLYMGVAFRDVLYLVYVYIYDSGWVSLSMSI